MAGLPSSHFRNPLASSLIFLALTCAAATEIAGQTYTLEARPSSNITFGGTLTVTVRLTPASDGIIPPISDVGWEGIDGLLRLTSQVADAPAVYSFVFEPMKAADPFKMNAKIEGFTGNILTVSIAPQVTSNNLDLTSSNFAPSADPNTKKLLVKQQAQAIVHLKLRDNAAIPDGALKVDANPKEIATASLVDSTIVVNGRAPGSATVTVSSNDKEIYSFSVEIVEAVKRIEASNKMTFTKGDAAKALTALDIQVEGKAGTKWQAADAIAKLNFRSTNIDVVRISSDRNSLEIHDVGEAELEISAKEDPSITKIVVVNVLPKAAKVEVDEENVTLIVKQSRSVQATVKDESGREVPNVSVTFECEGAAADCAKINLAPKSNNRVEIGADNKVERVRVIAKVQGKPEVTPASIRVSVIAPDQITDFRPLLIRMDMIDEQMAKDLFGRKAADEFYIAKVNLFNKLRKTDTEYFGDSILVYSESLQVRVALELKCRRGDAVPISQCENNEGNWIPVTEDMIRDHFNESFSLVPPISATEAVGKAEHPERCVIAAPKSFVGLYRPYSYETVAVTHDRRDERSIRSRILTVLNGAVSFTSFVTAIAVPGPGSDLPLGLEKTNALLIPSLEKLFPSMKEVQRQNVLTMVMRQLEEIPFGGNIERKIFFPKGALEGLWPGHRVRISGVSTFDACAEAAIVKKVGQQ